ncbi:MAG: SOS response-associated peptidase family protein [Betaproteobacteria bacterium]|nr:SOS response-associated peptidase family protein [Betaproteobacteria bacterium]
MRSRPGPDVGFALAQARWGLIPAWWKETTPSQSTFNARSEDAASKRVWRQPYRHSRCLVPAVGWYEWRSVESVDEKTGEVRKSKQPYFVHPGDRRLIAFAGLVSVYRPPTRPWN